MSADFDEILSHVLELLERERRVSYRAIQRRFGIGDDYIEDLKIEIIEAKRLGVDEKGRVLVAVDPEHDPVTAESVEASGLSSEILDLDAERRQLTVMFCDLAGSTALSERLEVEELREAIRGYQEAAVSVISRDEGHVAQYLGDGLLVYFGYPRAHEDDPRRAVRAGLGIVEAIRDLNSQLGKRLGVDLSVRIGIHTGMVVVGEVGSGETRERLALGDTPNVAARLQNLANLNTVVASQTTKRLMGDDFEFASLGRHELKGLSDAAEVFEVRGIRHADSRASASRATDTPLEARSEEKETLLRLWHEARQSNRQAVLVSGEPGIGKSRLTSEVCAEVSDEEARILLLQCAAYAQQSALFPVIELLRPTLGFLPEDSPETRLDKLEAWFDRFSFASPENTGMLAWLLSLPTERYPVRDLSPQKLKQRTLEIVVSVFEEESRRQPLLLLWEDLHWADPTSLEVIELMLGRLSAAQLLVILTARAEFEPPWPDGSVIELELGRLTGPGVERIIERVAQRKALPQAVVRELVERADGVPLFIEELTKNLLETDLLVERSDRFELARPLDTLGIPQTLRDSLMSRLDRLVHGRRVAQLGAAIGRSFPDGLVRQIWPEEEGDLALALQELVDAELVQPGQEGDEPIWVFKHALIQDAAYDSLLRSTRRDYHRLIAEAIRETQPETVERQPELLAHHYAQADAKQRAIELFGLAGKRAIRASANLEAIEHLSRGLALLRMLPESDERTEQILGLLILMVGPQLATKGYGAAEVGELLEEVTSLSREAGESPRLFEALLGLWGFVAVRGDLPEALSIGERLIGLAEILEDPGLTMEAFLRSGIGLGVVGRLEEAREHLERSLSLYDSERDRAHAYQYGQDPDVCCRCVLALVLWLQGFPDTALDEVREAVRRALDLDHAFTLAWAHLYAGIIHGLRREPDEALEQARLLIALCDEHGFAYRLAQGRILEGWARSLTGEPHSAQVQAGIEAVEATGAGAYRPYYYALLAECYRLDGEPAKGSEALVRALELVAADKETFYEAELHRLLGDLALEADAGSVDDARASYECALEIARAQGARSWELRAAVSMATAGTTSQAPEQLQSLVDGFSEGLATPDLEAARKLLAG